MLPPQIVSTGLKDIIVLVDSRQTLDALTPDHHALASHNKATDTVGFHLATTDTIKPEATAYSRNFAPLYGIDEESATGTSTAALSYYLKQHQLLPDQASYKFEQGFSYAATE